MFSKVMALLALGLDIARSAQAEVLVFDDFVERLGREDRKLVNITVHGTAQEFRCSGPAVKWEAAPEREAEVLYRSDGTAFGKGRLDVIKSRSQWSGGAEPTLQHSYSVSYNGRRGMTARLTVQNKGETRPLNFADVSPERPVELRGGVACMAGGLRYSTFAQYPDAGLSTAMYLRDEAKRIRAVAKVRKDLTPELAAERVAEGGRTMVHVRIGIGAEPCREWWLDEAHGLAMVRFRESDARRRWQRNHHRGTG